MSSPLDTTGSSRLPFPEYPPLEPILSDKQYILLKKTLQVAIKVLFPLGATLMVASITPIVFQTAVVTCTTIGTSFLSLFFFQPAIFNQIQRTKTNLSPIGKNEFFPQTIQLAEEPLSETAPRGIFNGGNNCWVSSVLQILRVSPFIMDWILNDPDLHPELLPLREFYQLYNEAAQSGSPIVKVIESAEEQSSVAARGGQITEADEKEPLVHSLQGAQKEDFWDLHQKTSPECPRHLSRECRKLAHRLARPIFSIPYDSRENFSTIPIDPVQVDAMRALMAFLTVDCLPDHLKLNIEETKTYDLKDHLPFAAPDEGDIQAGISIEDGCKTRKALPPQAPFLSLSIDPEKPNSIPSMLNDYCHEVISNSDPANHVRRKNRNQEVESYAVQSVDFQFLNAPPSLFIQIKRATSQRIPKPPESILTSIPLLNWFFGPLKSSESSGEIVLSSKSESNPQCQLTIGKNDTEVTVPLILEIPIKNRGQVRYELKGSVAHHGPKMNEGHYTSYIMGEDGRGYHCNDSEVTPVDREFWPLCRQYIYHYVRVDED